MSKLVKLSDGVGAALEEYAKEHGKTMAGAVGALLDDASSLADIKEELKAIDTRLGGMGRFLKEQFAKLQSTIEDTTVDRLSARPSSGDRSSGSSIVQTYDEDEVRAFWRVVREEEERTQKMSPAWWNKIASKAASEWNEFPDKWEIRDGALCFSDDYMRYPIFKASYFLEWREHE